MNTNTKWPSFLEQRQLNMTCGTVTCGSGHGFRFHAMLKGVLWWIGHLGYWLLLSCVCWVTSFARDPTVHSSMTLLLVRSPGFGNRRSKIFNAVVFKISHKWNRRGRGQTIQTSPKPRAWQQRCPHTFGRFVCFTPWWHLAVTSRLPSVCVCVCVCCRWRWSRAACSVLNRDESSRSPEESPTCCWAKTRRRRRRTQPPPEPSLRWDCGYRGEREREKREAGLWFKVGARGKLAALFGWL